MVLHKKFIIIEGIDGAGKGVVSDAIKDFLESEGLRILDLRKENVDLRKKDEIFFKKYDAILTCEPTYFGPGLELREEMLKNLPKYTARQVSEKFAEDRNILYEKVVIPALEKGMIVVQDRSVVSSLVYQVSQAIANKEKFTIEDVRKMNKTALSNPPWLIIVQDVEPETAFSRLHKRKEKQDDSDFEKIDALKRNAEGYRAKEWRELFREGTEIRDLDCNLEIDAVKINATRIVSDCLGKTND